MANKVVVDEIPPFYLAGIRFCVAAVIIFLFALLFRVNPIVSANKMKNAAIAGFLFLTAGNGLAVWALKYVDSGFSSVIISAQPLVLLIMLRIKDKKPIQPKSLIGIALGMIGIWLLISQKELVTGPDQWKGIGALFLALIAWGYASLFVSSVDLPKNQFINGAYQMIFGGMMMMIISFFFEDLSDSEGILGLSNNASMAMIYLILFGSIVAFTSFNYLLVRISPEKVSSSTYVNPIVALIAGWYFLDEHISPQSIWATVILFAGVYFINSVRFSAPKLKFKKRNI